MYNLHNVQLAIVSTKHYKLLLENSDRRGTVFEYMLGGEHALVS